MRLFSGIAAAAVVGCGLLGGTRSPLSPAGAEAGPPGVRVIAQPDFRRGPSRGAEGARGPAGGGDGRDGFSGGNGSVIELEGGGIIDEDTVRTARETASHSTGTPEWKNERGFEKDVFTFTRVIFRSNFRMGGFMRSGWTGWVNDYPDSDLNISWRLQQLTSLKVDPDTRVVKLTHPDLFDYPFIYMVKPGRMVLREEEIGPLRKYLLNGGALMMDDTWGDAEWQNIVHEMGRVLPTRAWTDLPKDHGIFHCIFPLEKDRLQVPPIQRWSRTGSSSRNGQETAQAFFRAMLDDSGRIMVFSAHNTDLGDGWEREGENTEYFHTFSESRAYPFAVNIVFYLMTH
jgi:hypothetical protein